MIALAFDLGGSSGKAVAGRFDGQRLHVSEVHRFRNEPVRASGRLHWDILRLLHEIKVGIGTAANAGSGEIESLAIDAWGCDFGLLDRHGELIGNPYHYRDELARGAMEEVLQIIPRTEVFARTGCQFMPINTLYQLFALRRARAETLARADTLLLIPDLLRFFLTGERSTEATIASTTQFLGIANGDWDRALLERLGLPTNLLTAIVAPATPAGRLLPEVASEIGTAVIPVPTVAGHDTASAVAAVPAEGHFAFLSSGTWSLLGTELQRPVVDERALAWNFTNEVGIGGTYRLLRNITGLWLVEGCRRAWERQGRWPGYEAIGKATRDAPAFQATIDPNDPSFLNPVDMPDAIAAYCRATGQTPPESTGSVMRCVLESLALAYRLTLEHTEALTGHHFPGLHVVGGGTRNETLLQFTADAIGGPVWSGPTEATAIGNLLGQLMASGRIASVDEGRALVRESFSIRTFEPQGREEWDEAFHRFQALRPM
ncbi:MAG: carbohydrate kinase [Thermomicrobiales bacterium]|nr:carbohydrate kinase [Thermomicrobiales bacterium]MCD6057118.1 carbohydrate kinase [Thermomicrobiales bacterium]